MIRYPLIEARFQRTAWCATPEIITAVYRAFRRPQGVEGVPSAQAVNGKARSKAYKVSNDARTVLAGSGSLVTMAPNADMNDKKCVAVIPVFGVIGKYLSLSESLCGGFDLNEFEEELQEAANDPTVSDIVLHFGTPGGTITGVSEVAQLISQVCQKKSVYAFTDSEVCSAGYWMASACTGIFCSDFATIGSIGVYLAWIDEAKAMEDEGLELKLFKDGTFKACTLPGQLTAEAGQLLQAEVEAIGSAFRSQVRTSRSAATGVTVSDDTMQGQTFLGRDAVSLGLADGTYRCINDLLLDILSQP